VQPQTCFIQKRLTGLDTGSFYVSIINFLSFSFVQQKYALKFFTHVSV